MATSYKPVEKDDRRLAATTVRKPRFKGVREFWQILTRGGRGSYRADLHYMRGPGPKWREKHPYAVIPVMQSNGTQKRIAD